ncbi:MAG: Hsp20/alpha crystallin family protein [Ferruginibacter sp.]
MFSTISKYNFSPIFNSAFESFSDSESFDLFKDLETGEQYIEIDFPGVKKEGLKVSIEDRKVFLSLERKGNMAYKYDKVLTLPKHIETTTCRATLENGVLKLSFKQKEDLSFKRKSIDIQ